MTKNSEKNQVNANINNTYRTLSQTKLQAFADL